MRTIEFRGRRLDNGEWVYGSLLCNGVAYRIVVWDKEGYSEHLVDPDTVGQFTGLHDKNGNKIYEGDIVRVRVTNDCFKKNPRFRNGVVTFCEHDGGWSNGCYFRFFPQRMEVIGNIHDNPELMKGGAQ